MANTYFQFKQFRVEQDQCAMKVCTDSCLFGALVPVAEAASILDIGTGTGLLALMAAQRSSAIIYAVEIDVAAAKQAQENFIHSPWGNRLHLYKGALQSYEIDNTQLFDVIISNPPFYEKSLKSTRAGRNQAMHTVDLPFADLLRFSQKYLKPTGQLFLLLPPFEGQIISEMASNFNLFLQKETKIFTRTNGKHIRGVWQFGFTSPSPELSSSICIRTATEEYTREFRELLQPFYLHF